MTNKLLLKSNHAVIYTVDVEDVESIFYCKPTDPDILTVLMKDGKRLYCDEVCPVDSLQKEPKKCMYTNEHYTDEDRKVLCEDCEERCEYSKKEEPVNEKDKLRALSDGKQHLGWLDDANALEEPIEEAAESIIPKCDTYIEHDNGSIEPVYPYSTLIYMFKAGANWQKDKIDEILFRTVLPRFMHGGEAEEVVAMLDEEVNHKED